MIIYNVHHLIEVRVDERVPEALRRAIDFQIAHFRQSGSSAVPKRRIDVFPYDDWAVHSDPPISVFHDCRGIERRWVDSPDHRLACLATEDGYRVYADTPAFLVNLLIQFILVTQGVTLVHAAAVADAHGRVTLLPGPGGVGKTALLGELVQRHGCRLLGDDIVGITCDGRCLAFPRSFVLKQYHESVYPAIFKRLKITKQQVTRLEQPRLACRLGNLIADNMPMKGLVRYALSRAGRLGHVQTWLATPRPRPFLATVPVQDVFGDHCVLPAGVIDRVVFLERWTHSHFDQKPMSRDSMAQRLFSIIHHEWVGHMRQFWAWGSLELVDLPTYFYCVNRVVVGALSGVSCQRMCVPQDATPERLLAGYLAYDRSGDNKEAA